MGMRPRSLRPCGMQRAMSACRPGTPKWDLLGEPVALGFKGSERGSKLGPVAKNGENIAYTAHVRLHDLGHTACRGSLIWV